MFDRYSIEFGGKCSVVQIECQISEQQSQRQDVNKIAVILQTFLFLFDCTKLVTIGSDNSWHATLWTNSAFHY